MKKNKPGVWHHTVVRSGVLSGKGLHTGRPCSLEVKPASVNTGIVFFKNGKRLGSLSQGALVQARGERCTAVGKASEKILTVEHFLASVWCLGLSNLEAHVEGPELPAMDGSALGFVRFLKKLGSKKQARKRTLWRIREPIFFAEPGKAIQALPSETLSVSYTLDYPHPALRNQSVHFSVDAKTFEKELAPARTFCTDAEADLLKAQGFGRGADTSNTLVMTSKGPLRNRLRFRDECARHKALDLLGDLGLLGHGLSGHIIGLRSGHALNRQLVEEIRRQNVAQ